MAHQEQFWKECEQHEKKRAAQQRARNVEHQVEIRRQMKEHEARRQRVRQNVVEKFDRMTDMNFPSFGEDHEPKFPPTSDILSYVKDRKEHLKEQLDSQVQQKKKLQKATKEADKAYAANARTSNEVEVHRLLAEEAGKKAHERILLAESWERSTRMKQARRAIERFDVSGQGDEELKEDI